MVLVNGLAVHDRLYRCSVVVHFCLRVAAELRDVAVLTHVEMQPLLFVEPLEGSVSAGRVKGHEMSSAISHAQSFGHGADDFFVLIAFDGAIAAKDPNNRF